MDDRFLASVRAAFAPGVPALTLGAPVHEGRRHAEPLVALPLEMATATG